MGLGYAGMHVDAQRLERAADMLERHRIKRVPVVTGGKVVGVVSRANLLQALVARPIEPVPDTVAVPDDTGIRNAIVDEIRDNALAGSEINVIVANGAVSLWGTVQSEDQRRAILISAENAVGVIDIEDHLAIPTNRRLAGL